MNEQELNRYALIRAIKADGKVPVAKLEKLLWKDESGDVFLITKSAEIFLYWGYKPNAEKKAILGMYVWGKVLYSQMAARGLISHEMPTDDSFHHVRTDMRNLPLILSLQPGYKKRPHVRGNFINHLEHILGHKILPYNPDLGE